MAGSVTYSRRFYEEVLREPATASPLIFPETVFNAPASHLAAFLGVERQRLHAGGRRRNFFAGTGGCGGLAGRRQVDGVVVVGAEEMDWVVADAMRLFQRDAIHSAGAGRGLFAEGKIRRRAARNWPP